MAAAGCIQARRLTPQDRLASREDPAALSYEVYFAAKADQLIHHYQIDPVAKTFLEAADSPIQTPDPRPDGVATSADQRCLYVHSMQTGRIHLYRVDPATGRLTLSTAPV